MDSYIKVCVGALVKREGNILLVKRKNPPDKGLWALPGGKVNFGEPLKRAVEREVKEETGLEVRAVKPIYVFEIFHEKIQEGKVEHFVIIDFLAEYKGGDLCAADDAQDALWVELEELSHLPLSKYTSKFLREELGIDVT